MIISVLPILLEVSAQGFSDIVSLLLYIAYRNCLLSYIVGKGDEVWEEAYVHYPDGKILAFPLVFSNFNGHYKLDKSRTR